VRYFEWTSGIELGHAEIDRQHRQMLLLGEELAKSQAKPEGYQPDAIQLQALIDFTQEHFAFEETLMHSTGYPAANEHTSAHTLLLGDLKRFCSRMQQGLHSDHAGLISFLWHWIVLHIGSEDRDFVSWLKSHVPNGGKSYKACLPVP